MTFEPTALKDVWIVRLEVHSDERGSLGKCFDRETFLAQGLNTDWAQSLYTKTSEPGTIRGMHWQAEPHPEVKLIRCSRGKVFDVLVDVRRDSITFGEWFSCELSEEGDTLLYAPAGVAHGFQTLVDDCELNYLISSDYHGKLQRGFYWNDPAVGIQWPLECSNLSERDKDFPSFDEAVRR